MDAPHEPFSYGGRRFLRIKLSVRRRRALCTVPQRIGGRYEVRELLAHGGGGVVLVGYDVPTNHDVLIKAALGYRLKKYAKRADTAGAVEHVRRVRHRLQTERRILVQLRRRGANAVPHPHDYVYDWNPALAEPVPNSRGADWSLDDPDLVRSEPFLVMQHVRGTSLHELLRSRWKEGMPVAEALHVLRQVAAVLQALHEPFTIENRTWHVVYQDLKPANILIGEALEATLVDFGGCQLVIDGTLVLSGAHTQGFCPPEQATRERALTQRSGSRSGAERLLEEAAVRLAAVLDVSLERAHGLVDEQCRRLLEQFDVTPNEAAQVLGRVAEDAALETAGLESLVDRRAAAQVQRTRVAPAADVYGVGSTLYHMLTGINPQSLLSRPSVPSGSPPGDARAVAAPRARARAVIEWDWGPLEQRCPQSVCEFVRRCLATDPADRFRDAEALAGELAKLP